MKLFKFSKILLALLFLLSASVNFSFAGGTTQICPGQPVNLIWTSTNAQSCSGGLVPGGNNSCEFTASLGGTIPINNAQSGCTVNYSCTNGNSASDSATLVVNNRNDYWNGTQCVCNASTPVWNAGANICQACPANTGWNGTVCVPVLATGNISANPSPCIIPSGASSCTSTITWSSTNNTTPNVRIDYNNASILSSNANGSVSIPWISYGGNSFELRNGSTIVSSVIVKGTCAANSTWNNTICAADPCPNGLAGSYRPSCACPPGQAIVGATCVLVGDANLAVSWSGLLNPNIDTLNCPTPLTQITLTRNGVSITAATGADTSVTSTNIETVYNYVLTCTGTGPNAGITRSITKSITIPPKVIITNLENTSTPIGDSIATIWNSTGNECRVYENNGTTLIKTATRSGAGPNYNYSINLNPGAPDYRTELNSQHVGSNTLGYKIKCIDTAQQIRGVATGTFIAEVFKKPTASITRNGNNLTFICTPDYNKVDIKANGLSLVSAGYPKTYTSLQSGNFSDLRAALPNTTYLLTCSYNNYVSQAVSSTDLELFGSINGVSDIINNTITSNSADGRIDNIYYQAFNYDTISVTKNGVPVTLTTSPYYPINGKANINSSSDTGVYDPTLTIVVKATKGSVTKVLTLIQNKVSDVSAAITVTPTIGAANQDSVDVKITCKNSTSYELYKNGGGTPISSGAVGEEIFNTSVTDIASITGAGTEATYKVKCIASASNFKEASAKAVIPSKTPAKITAFLAQPNQIACPGGNDSATLKFMMSNTVGKVCRIIPTAISSLNNAAQKNVQMTALDTLLRSSIYKSSNSEGQKSLAAVIDDANSNGVSAGQIVLSSVSKLSTDKRLFTYSTKFKLECDSKTATPQYAPGNVTYSTKSVEMLSACVGQD